MKLLDTDFLIDLQRELTGDEEGPARRFLREQEDEKFAISVIAMLEFLEGYSHTRDGEDFLEPFVMSLVPSCSLSRSPKQYRRPQRNGPKLGGHGLNLEHAKNGILMGLRVFTNDLDMVFRNGAATLFTESLWSRAVW